MSVIRASCEICGDVELTVANMSVSVWVNESRGEYSFRCPLCKLILIRGAEPPMIDALVASGVVIDTKI